MGGTEEVSDGEAPSVAWQAQNRRLSELIALARGGSVSAFEELYAAAAPWLLRQIRRLVGEAHAEDVLAELFIQVWRSLHDYDGSRAVPAVWLSMMARSRALDHLRREKRHVVCPTEHDDAPAELEAAVESPEQLLSRAQQRQLVQLSLCGGALSAQERLVVGLAYFRDHNEQEISTLTGLPPATVRSALLRAYGKLRQQLATHGPLPAARAERPRPSAVP